MNGYSLNLWDLTTGYRRTILFFLRQQQTSELNTLVKQEVEVAIKENKRNMTIDAKSTMKRYHLSFF